MDVANGAKSLGGVTRIVVLGGGFAGVYAARHLERQFRRDRAVQVTLVSRVNYFLMTPLLFEAGSGVLEPRHAVNPIRPLLKGTRFVQAEVTGIDLDRRVVRARPADGEEYDIGYDHVVLALGGVTNTKLVPGSEHARTFKTLADAIALRNHVIQSFERADIEPDPRRKKQLLTFAVVGGGLVGVELMGELNSFARAVADIYPHVRWEEARFELIEAGPHLVPEFDKDLAGYAEKVLTQRGVRVRTNTFVASIEPGRVNLAAGKGGTGGSPAGPGTPGGAGADGTGGAGGETIEAATIVASTGVIPSPLVADLPLERDRKGRVAVDATMRSKSRPEVWALGDCASIPDPQGKPYPPLAQHALREAKTVAHNIAAAVRGGTPEPFVYTSKGTLAALGHFKGVGEVMGIKIYGFIGWWVWRTYYLFQMPQWSRRLRIVVDWTIALVFKYDVVQLDLVQGEARPGEANAPGDRRRADEPSGGPQIRAAEGASVPGAEPGADRNAADQRTLHSSDRA